MAPSTAPRGSLACLRRRPVAAAGGQGRTGCARAPWCHVRAALDLDIAAVQADQLLDERQSDADAVVRARRRPPDAPESLEQTRQLLLGNSDAGVRDGQLRHASTRRRPTAISPENVNLNALESRLRTIFSHASSRRRPGRRAACTRSQPKPRALDCRSERARDVARLTTRGRLARRPVRSRPESICAKSISELTSVASRRALRAATSTSSLVCGVPARPPAHRPVRPGSA